MALLAAEFLKELLFVLTNKTKVWRSMEEEEEDQEEILFAE